jgi:hypothetical protein
VAGRDTDLNKKRRSDLKRIQDEVRAILSNEQGLDAGYYAAHYTARERRQLSKALNQTLWEEVVLFRTCIKKFFGLTARNSEQLDLQALSGVVDTLGLSCTRLARMMQVNQALAPAKADQSEAMINEVLGRLLDEWEGEEVKGES